MENVQSIAIAIDCNIAILYLHLLAVLLRQIYNREVMRSSRAWSAPWLTNHDRQRTVPKHASCDASTEKWLLSQALWLRRRQAGSTSVMVLMLPTHLPWVAFMWYANMVDGSCGIFSLSWIKQKLAGAMTFNGKVWDHTQAWLRNMQGFVLIDYCVWLIRMLYTFLQLGCRTYILYLCSLFLIYIRML